MTAEPHGTTLPLRPPSTLERRGSFYRHLHKIWQKKLSADLSADRSMETAQTMARIYVEYRLSRMNPRDLVETSLKMGVALERILNAKEGAFLKTFETEWLEAWDQI